MGTRAVVMGQLTHDVSLVINPISLGLDSGLPAGCPSRLRCLGMILVHPAQDPEKR